MTHVRVRTPAAAIFTAGFCIAVAADPSTVAAGEPSTPPGLPRDYVRVVGRPWQRVGLTVTVVDRGGRPVRGLRRDEFRLLEDGEPVPIADFGVEGERTDRPLSVAVLLDLSRSMGRQVRQVREAATVLLTSLRPGDEIMVATFNDQVTVLTPFTGRIDDPESTLKNIGTARGGTALFRSIGEILRDLRERPGRKVILVVSDGLDTDLERGGACPAVAGASGSPASLLPLPDGRLRDPPRHGAHLVAAVRVVRRGERRAPPVHGR